MTRPSEKVALITGGSSGIGRATAVAFAKTGARVVVAARRRAEGEETVRLVEAAGSTGLFVPADVRLAAELRALVAACVEAYGGLDYAFNNAGIEGTGYVKTADYDEETFRQVIDVNLTGVFLSMKYEIPALLARGGGAIVNMSSVAGLMGGAVGAAYHASKHGVVGLTKTAALDYAKAGIRVNAVCPAVITTDMAKRLFYQDPGIAKEIVAAHPIGRIGTVDEVADAVVWLCSDQASFITGETLRIDGGMLAGL
ncbi:MAG: SDR family oxidoreductase [Chromatiales bacterium]|nr:SDR family oxidoreductase [Chromatiales bacterium]